MRTLLFLCTGNYYRSRFAEHWFNALVQPQGLDWRADSRGLDVENCVNNTGAISPTAVARLAEFGVTCDATRYPLQVQEQDLRHAALIIALKEAEHRPYLSQRHPAWVDRIEYWHVHDGNPTPVYDPLQDIAAQVQRLIQRLVVVPRAI